MKHIPIVVDLDGTLINTDMLHESMLQFLRSNPLKIFFIFFWMIKGKAVLKRRLAENFDFDAKFLPYNNRLIAWLIEQKKQGRRIVLSTATDVRVAKKIVKYLGIFDELIGSDGLINNGGSKKSAELVKRFGLNGFDYMGNSATDLKVWKFARSSFLVNTNSFVDFRARKIAMVKKEFHGNHRRLIDLIHAFRFHQWLKNTLLLVPLLAAHQFGNVLILKDLLIAFISFGLCASSVYIVNDLFDLDSDRQHPRKNKRPFASGAVSITFGLFLIPLLLGSSFFLANIVGINFLLSLLLYSVITFAYSLWLKRLVLVDCITLALLYTLRIIAGAAAAKILLSFWLLAFSIFLFFSLAFVKRYAELQSQHLAGKDKTHGRGYLTTDAPFIQTLGLISGFISSLVLAFYLNSENVTKLYRTPEIIWGCVPLMMLWISWVWMKAHRGEMHDDPIIFAIKDKASILIGLLFLMVFIVAGIW